MSIWEYLFATDGWKKANGIGAENDGQPRPPSEDEFFAAVAEMEN